MTARHYSNSQNLVISFEYSWFLAKNLSKFCIPALKTPQPLLQNYSLSDYPENYLTQSTHKFDLDAEKLQALSYLVLPAVQKYRKLLIDGTTLECSKNWWMKHAYLLVKIVTQDVFISLRLYRIAFYAKYWRI